jgi:hypothetical protein
VDAVYKALIFLAEYSPRSKAQEQQEYDFLAIRDDLSKSYCRCRLGLSEAPSGQHETYEGVPLTMSGTPCLERGVHPLAGADAPNMTI